MMIQRVTSSNVRPQDLHTSSPKAVVQKPRQGESGERLWTVIATVAYVAARHDDPYGKQQSVEHHAVSGVNFC